MTNTDNERPKPGVVNFSRPRLYSKGQDESQNYHKRTSSETTVTQASLSHVKSVSAFHQPTSSQSSSQNDPFPDEPRFSTDSETLSNTSANAGRRAYQNTAQLRGPPINIKDQRYTGTPRQNSTSTTSSSHTYGSSNDAASLSRPSTGESTKKLMPLKSILKQTSVEVSSERASSEGGEDVRSHHTVSESGDSRLGEEGKKWSSSDYDTSGLSEKEVQKLLKKGKNPALVAEMKAARKGKGIVGIMTGTSYVS